MKALGFVIFTILMLLIPASIVYLVYCGFTTMYARDGELIGQAKRLTLVTPFWSSFCEPYYAFDVSLGVLQGGVGSMSTQDAIFTVRDTGDLAAMKAAVEAGAIVKVTYDDSASGSVYRDLSRDWVRTAVAMRQPALYRKKLVMVVGYGARPQGITARDRRARRRQSAEH